MQAMGELEQFGVYAVHDHYPSYYAFDVWHIACNAHHLRQLIQPQMREGRIELWVLPAPELMVATSSPAKMMSKFTTDLQF